MTKYDRTGLGASGDFTTGNDSEVWPISEWELREELADLFDRRGLILERAVHSSAGQEYVIQYSEAPTRKPSPTIDALIEELTNQENRNKLIDILDHLGYEGYND